MACDRMVNLESLWRLWFWRRCWYVLWQTGTNIILESVVCLCIVKVDAAIPPIHWYLSAGLHGVSCQ